MNIREERPQDRAAIHAVNEAAFGRADEADLVDALRFEGAVLVSLVAEVEGRIVGHILFSRMSVEGNDRAVPAVALAPLAVLPKDQRRGIGSELVRAGLAALREKDELYVMVLGHPSYYPRFGFSCEDASHLKSPFPSEAFMALNLNGDAPLRGTVKYATAFGLD